jgi:hypothetical protein
MHTMNLNPVLEDLINRRNYVRISFTATIEAALPTKAQLPPECFITADYSRRSLPRGVRTRNCYKTDWLAKWRQSKMIFSACRETERGAHIPGRGEEILKCGA